MKSSMQKINEMICNFDLICFIILDIFDMFLKGGNQLA